MAAEGHQTRRSETDSAGRRETAIINESLEAPPRRSVVTLKSYRPPAPRLRAARGTPSRVIAEAAEEGAPVATVQDVALPDAAVGSFGSPIVLEVVIGTDDRIKVSQVDVSRNPFRQICALRITAKSGKAFVGTGWFVGPRAVATAGHCVFLHKEGGWPNAIEVIPAKFGDREPLQRFRATRFRAVDGWVDQKRQDIDYGVILLDDGRPGDQLGWFTVEDKSDSALTGAVANISGYPADRDQARFQYFHARPLSAVKPALIEYDIDTFGGQSGSPIWLDSGGSIEVIGVHTNGASSGNSGTRIVEAVIDNLLAWRDE